MSPRVARTRLVVTPDNITINKGETRQLTASVAGVTWSSSNTLIATVSSTGLVRGANGGNCTITARLRKDHDTCAVIVVAEVVPDPPPVPPGVRGPQISIVCPLGATYIAPGSSIQSAIDANPSGTSFCLGAGVHTIGASIVPKSGNVFTGQYGATIDGTGWVTSDFSQGAFRAWNVDIDNVVIRNLYIRNMPQKGIAISGNNSTSWLYDYLEVYACVRDAINVGQSFSVKNCILRDNPYGGYSGFIMNNVLFDNNEIARNGTEQKLVAGVGGIFRNNWVHHNAGDGIWYDTDNTSSLIENNTVEDNGRFNIHYEISGSGIIRNNTVLRAGDTGIFNSTSKDVEIYGNTLIDNFRGIQMYVKPLIVGGGTMPGGYDLLNVDAHDNSIFVGTRSGSWACTLGGTPLPLPAAYLDGTKNLRYRNNHYKAPNLTTNWWYWGGNTAVYAKNWAAWQAIPQDATGTFELR